MWDEESFLINLSLVSHINFISICSLALLTFQAGTGTFVDWKTDWGSVVVTVVVVWISDKSNAQNPKCMAFFWAYFAFFLCGRKSPCWMLDVECRKIEKGLPTGPTPNTQHDQISTYTVHTTTTTTTTTTLNMTKIQNLTGWL